VIGRHAWRGAGMSGDRWKVGDNVMYSIYVPVFTVSLASKKNRPKLLAIHPLVAIQCRIFILSITKYLPVI